MICAVSVVVVTPMKCGTAYAHAADGECIAFTADRASMVALCNEVRQYNEGMRSRVLIETDDWEGVSWIAKSTCFAHHQAA